MSAEFHIGILAILSVMALIAGVNMLSIRSIRRGRKAQTTPMVSVLVPARNEENNIGRCIATLDDQGYPNYEVLVLDDNSEDRTGIIVQEWARTSSRVRYVKGEPLPSGWVGKNFACHQLSALAKGDLLLFVDADTIHSRESISSGVAAAQLHETDLLTVIPYQIMQTFWEKTILPFLHFSTFCFLPFPLVTASRNPRFAMANGQYMLFRRKAYDAIGGHEAVKDVMVEDVWLSRRIKKNGFALRIMEGGIIVSCRMYFSFKSIWQGFSKNLFAGFRFSLPAISAVILFNFLTSVLPFFFLTSILLGGTPAAFLPIVATQVGIILGIRFALAGRFRMSYFASLLHPVAMIVVIGIAMNSVRWILFGHGSRWKGRQYKYNKHALATTRSQY